MFKLATASFFAFAAFVVAQANDPSINTPASLVQCQPAQLSWSALKEPVYVAIIPGGQPGAAPIHDFGLQAPGTKSLTWTVDVASGTSITAQVKDATGAVAYSANVNVQSSSDSSCVKPNQAPPPGAPSSAAPSASSRAADVSVPAAGTSAAAATSAPAPAATTHASSSSASARAPATATSAPPASGTGVAAANGALPGAQIGWTALMGALAVLIVA